MPSQKSKGRKQTWSSDLKRQRSSACVFMPCVHVLWDWALARGLWLLSLVDLAKSRRIKTDACL